MDKKVAIFTAAGVGDGMIMMIAAQAYKEAGYDVTVFNNYFPTFGKWFEGFTFLPRPFTEEYKEVFSKFPIIVVHHENSHHAKAFAELDPKKHRIILFYNNYRPGKHPPLEKDHYAFNEKVSMGENVAKAIHEILDQKSPSINIGMKIPENLIHRRNQHRVVIHPTSSGKHKNWGDRKYLRLAKRLQKRGFEPVFILNPKEQEKWSETLKKNHLDAPHTPTLSDLAALIYEAGYFIGNDSGPGHIASYLQVPMITLVGNPAITHWKPVWSSPRILMPPKWAPNMKGRLRLRENHWQLFVPVTRVFKEFIELSSRD